MIDLIVLGYFFLVLNFLIFSYLNELSYLNRNVIIPLVISLIIILVFKFIGSFDNVISNDHFNSLLLMSGIIVVTYFLSSLMTADLRDAEKHKEKKGREYILQIFDWMRLHFLCIAISFLQIMIIIS